MHDVWVRVSLGSRRQQLLGTPQRSGRAAAQRADIHPHAPHATLRRALCSLPQLTGYIQVPGDDEYEFKLESADGSRLFINDQPVIDLGEPAYKCCRVLLLASGSCLSAAASTPGKASSMLHEQQEMSQRTQDSWVGAQQAARCAAIQAPPT